MRGQGSPWASRWRLALGVEWMSESESESESELELELESESESELKWESELGLKSAWGLP